MDTHDITRFRWIPKEEMLTRIRKSVSDFMTVFADLEPDHEHHAADPDDLNPALTAVVGFDGEYRGVVWVRCSERLAVRIAAGMWGERPAAADNNVLDAMSEMVNIFGEDITIFLSPRNRNLLLSIPSVFRDDESACTDFMHSPENLCCSFVHEGERMLVGMMMKKSL